MGSGFWFVEVLGNFISLVERAFKSSNFRLKKIFQKYDFQIKEMHSFPDNPKNFCYFNLRSLVDFVISIRSLFALCLSLRVTVCYSMTFVDLHFLPFGLGTRPPFRFKKILFFQTDLWQVHSPHFFTFNLFSIQFSASRSFALNRPRVVFGFVSLLSHSNLKREFQFFVGEKKVF